MKMKNFLFNLENGPLFEDNKNIKKKNKTKIDIYYLLIYSFFSFSIKFYFLGLRGCKEKIAEQCHEFNDITPYIKRGIETAISSILFSFGFFFIGFFKKHFIHKLIFILTYIIIISNTQGNDFIKHGTYNSILFILLDLICLIYINGLYFVILGFNTIKKNFVSIIILFLLISPFLFYIMRGKCINWNYGLGNIPIEYNENLDSCKIKNPKRCTIGMFGSLLDFSSYARKTCKGYQNTKIVFDKYLKDKQKNFSKYSYPDTTEFGDDYLSFTNEFPKMVEKKIWGFDEKTNNKEVTVEFKNGIGRINIDVKRKENLVKNRKKLYKNNKVKFRNIYIIYIDAISLQHFKRKLKKTKELIEKMLFTNKNKEKFFKKFEAFQFMKYHNIGINTKPNVIPLFYGNFAKSNKGIFISNYLKKKGFITGSEHNSCNRAIFDYPQIKNPKVKPKGFDHENFGLFCDTNYNDRRNKWSVLKGRNSFLKKCLYDEQTSKYLRDYFLDFCKKYKNERKYFSTIFTDGHEGTLEVIKYIDDDVHDLILELLKKYFDDESAIFIISDHGAHIPGIDNILFSQQKIIENFLGVFFMILPNNEKFNMEIIHQNEQVLVTPLDFYFTLLDMINIKRSKLHHSKLGESVFVKLDRKNRDCKSLKIPSKYCKCE